jgi:hypothetical protein
MTTSERESPLEIRLETPQVRGQRVDFLWHESRPSGLYQDTRFHLKFPDSVPLEDIPAALWWTVFLLCLHSHWALLRPCRIHLPVQLPPGARQLWETLIKHHAATLDALNPERPLIGEVRLIEGAEMLPSIAPRAGDLHCALAFSGGKDSLSHVGLLCEMGFKPLLVSTTALLPGIQLEASQYRARALAEVQSRRGLELLEVASDFRAQWANLLPREWGYRLSLNEITDTFLYTAALAVAGYARGATHLFLASENELSANAVIDGVYLQHSHFMYSGLTQAAVSRLLTPVGLRYGSLTSGLQSSQVQELVTRRYPDLANLQCSCWRGTDTVRACSDCSECRRLALISLACGGTPADLGVDMVRLMTRYHQRAPRAESSYTHLPDRVASRGFRLQYARAIHSITPLRMLSYLLRKHPGSLRKGALFKALGAFLKLRANTLADFPNALDAAGYRAAYLDLLDPALKARLEPVLSAQFPVAPLAEYAEQWNALRQTVDSLESAAVRI